MILRHHLDLEERTGKVGGLITIMTGLPPIPAGPGPGRQGYYVKNNMDRGFELFGHQNQQESVVDILSRLRQNQGQTPSFSWHMPTGQQSNILNRNLTVVQDANGNPLRLPRLAGKRQHTVEANTSRVSTSFRMPVEQCFGRQENYAMRFVAILIEFCGFLTVVFVIDHV